VVVVSETNGDVALADRELPISTREEVRLNDRVRDPEGEVDASIGESALDASLGPERGSVPKDAYTQLVDVKEMQRSVHALGLAQRNSIIEPTRSVRPHVPERVWPGRESGEITPGDTPTLLPPVLGIEEPVLGLVGFGNRALQRHVNDVEQNGTASMLVTLLPFGHGFVLPVADRPDPLSNDPVFEDASCEAHASGLPRVRQANDGGVSDHHPSGIRSRPSLEVHRDTGEARSVLVIGVVASLRVLDVLEVFVVVDIDVERLHVLLPQILQTLP
jgi:hypothetical protein